MCNSRFVLLGIALLFLTATCKSYHFNNDNQGEIATQALPDEVEPAGHNQAKNPFADTIIEWDANNNTLTPQRVKDLMLLFDKKNTETYEFIISEETPNYYLMGIRSRLWEYVPSEGQCTIVQKYLMEDSINFFLFAKKITPDSLYPVFFLSYPEAWMVEFD